MIEFKDIGISFDKKRIFAGLSFKIGKGLTLIDGKSGSGKTTLLRILLKRIRPSEGQVIYSEKYKISYLTQDAFFLPRLTITENVSYIASIQKDLFFDNTLFDKS